MKINAFTLKSRKGVFRDLKTSCRVSLPLIIKNGTKLPPIKEYIGLWDTGATGTVVTSKVVKELGLVPTGKITSHNANGSALVNTYTINVYLPNNVGFHFVKVTEGQLTGMDVLIGMDIISKGDFSITNVNGNTTFSFRIPSIKEIDYVKEGEKPKWLKLSRGYKGDKKRR